MAKKVALFHKKNPIKNTTTRTKNLRKVLKNFLYYLKSDTYMFAPLISSQSLGEPVKGKENVKEYLKSDSYMYAPFLLKDCDATIRLKGRVGDPTESVVMEEAVARKDRKIDENEDISRQVLVKHKLLHKETIKHVVHHNRRSSTVPAG